MPWLFAEFFKTEKFEGLAASTRKDYRWLTKRTGEIEVGAQRFGRYPWRAIKARHAGRIYALLEQEVGHTVAHYACRFARLVWKWGGRREHVDRDNNPWSGMELRGLPQRTAVWDREQVAAFVAKAGEKGWLSVSLAVQLAYWLGLRQADVLALTWADLKLGWVEIRKTKAQVPTLTAEYPELVTAFASADKEAVQVVVCETTKKPWGPDYFRHVFRDIADAAGIPKTLQFRDLRATAATEAADGGADVLQLRTVHGWSTTQIAARYARPSKEQARQAATARRKGRERPVDE